jgi:hypothetical protein
MTWDVSFNGQGNNETIRDEKWPGLSTNNYLLTRTANRDDHHRTLDLIKPKVCKTFYLEFEITAKTGTPTMNDCVVHVGPAAYHDEADAPGSGFGVTSNRGSHQGCSVGMVASTAQIADFKRAEGNISGSTTAHQMTWTSADPDNTFDGGMDVQNVGDWIGVLVDFNSPAGNLACEVSVFNNNIHKGTLSMPVSNPDEVWMVDFATQSTGTGSFDWTWNKEKVDWNNTNAIKDPIPWALPLGTSSYVETGYCRMRNHKANYHNARMDARLSNNSLKVTQQDSSVTSAQIAGAWGTVPRYTGKRYFEVTSDWTESDYSNPVWHIGLSCVDSHSNATSVTLPQPEHFAGISSNIGSAFYRQRFGMSDKLTNGQAGALRPMTAGDVFMFAVHFQGQDAASDGLAAIAHIWFGKNGTWLAGNPSTPTGHSDATANQAFPAPVPFCQFSTQAGSDGNRGFTFNFGGSAFAHTIPTGFTAWDDTTVPTDGF